MVFWQSAASSAAQQCRKLRGDRRSAALRGITSFAVRNIQTRSGLITRSCSGRLSPIACFGAIEVSKCFHVHTVSSKRERCKWKSLNGAENGAAKGYTSRVIVESRAATQPLSSSSKTPTTCCRTPLSGGGSSCSLAGCFSLPPLRGRVLLRPPKPQRHVGGGQPGGAGFLYGFLAGFCPAPPKIHRNLQIQWISVKFQISRNSGKIHFSHFRRPNKIQAKFRKNPFSLFRISIFIFIFCTS